MTAADKIAEARALIEPLMDFTPSPWGLVSLSGYGSPFSIRMAYHSDNPNAPKTHYGVQSVRTREDARLIAASPALRDTVADLADLAEVQAQRVEEWRQDYRALEGAHRVMREANARLIAERDAQARRIEALMSFSRPFADALDIECDFMTPPAPFEDGFDVRARARAAMLANEDAE